MRRTAARNFVDARGIGEAQGKKVTGRRCATTGRGEAGLRADRPYREAMVCGAVSPVERQANPSCFVTEAWVVGGTFCLPPDVSDDVRRPNEGSGNTMFPVPLHRETEGDVAVTAAPAGMAAHVSACSGVRHTVRSCSCRLPEVEKALRLTAPGPLSCLRYGLISPRWPFRPWLRGAHPATHWSCGLDGAKPRPRGAAHAQRPEGREEVCRNSAHIAHAAETQRGAEPRHRGRQGEQ